MIDAGLPSIVSKGAQVSLVGAILNRENTLSYTTSWRQLDGSLGGPSRFTLANSNTSTASFVAPTTLGHYGFEYKVVKTQPDGSQAITTAQTTVVVQNAPSGVFTVSAGDVQSINIGTVATLKATVGSQGTTSGVTYTYQWIQVGSSPANVTLSNGGTTSASFLPTVTGVYTFDLAVTATTIGSELEVQARKAIETNNDGLMVVPTDALDSATARLIVEEVWWSNLKRHNDRFFSNLNGNSSEQPKNPKNL